MCVKSPTISVTHKTAATARPSYSINQRVFFFSSSPNDFKPIKLAVQSIQYIT